MADFLSDEEMQKLESEGDFLSDEQMSAIETAGHTSPVDSAGRGLAQGATFNLRDEGAGFLASPTGGMKEIANKFGAGYDDKDVTSYKAERDASRSLDEAAKQANPKSFLAGQLGGAVATSFVPGLGLAEDVGLLSSAARGGAQGAAYGFGGSNAEDLSDLTSDAAKGAAVGTLAGSGGYGASQAIGKATNGAVNAAEDFVTAPSGTMGRVGQVLQKTVPRDLNRLTRLIPGGSTAKGLITEFAGDPVKKVALITADSLSDLAMKTPEALGKFGSILQAAVQRGPQAVAATHFILEQTNPEYQEQIRKLADQGED